MRGFDSLFHMLHMIR